MTYEVFHSYGGHVGPFQNIDAAIEYAARSLKGLRHASPHDREVIRERTADGIGGYGRVVAVVSRYTVCETCGHGEYVGQSVARSLDRSN
jgi:hypothetical protein